MSKLNDLMVLHSYHKLSAIQKAR